jgi:hypothetical protein
MENAEIVQNIDTTLDQLILNAEVLSDAELNSLTDTELDAFQKTQESLMQHLLQMDQMLEQRPQDKRSATIQIRDKRQRFENLKREYSEDLNETLRERRMILSKRRGKRFFELLGRKKKVLVKR